jgi:putative transposase
MRRPYGLPMPRRNRLQLAGALYHAGARGIRRSPVFLCEEDRLLFLTLLGDVVRRFHWQCHAYCLMTNHYHVALRTPDANIGDGMHRLNGLYAQAFNRRHRFKGHLFEERYWSGLVETEEHSLNLVRYIVLNPVRARLCALPHQWVWSSYRATAGLDPQPSHLDLRWMDSWAGSDSARVAYRAFVLEGLENGTPPPTTAVTET